MSSSLPPDPYKILGVSKDAQISEIRSAHRKLVLKCHPDKVQDPALKAEKQDEFQKVQQAYELLSNEADRQKYDDQVRLAELRKHMAKANISTPRSTRYTEFEVRTAEPPRASSYKPTTSYAPPSMPKTHAYSRSWEEDMSHGHRIFEPASRSSRREPTTYVDSRSKRESEREREKEKEAKEREKERERRKKSEKEEAAARREKEAKEARRAERKQRDKQRDKDVKRDSDDKKKHTKSYIEDYSEDIPTPKSERKKSSGKKYDDKRDRSSHRDEPPPVMRAFTEFATTPFDEPAQTSYVTETDYVKTRMSDAAAYIEASRAKSKRPTIYHNQPPAVPTPPPAPGQASAFPAPPPPPPVPEEDDIRRSSARPRRGSSESTRMQRDKAYRRSSREQMEEPILGASPPGRHPAQFQRASTATATMSTSPPMMHRTSTDTGFSRSAMPMRSQTYSYGEGADSRGRNRSRMQSQINEESDTDDAYEHRTRDRKHRNSRRGRSPEPIFEEDDARHPAYESRQPTYSRRLDPDMDNRYPYYHDESRPSMPSRDSGYSTSAGSAQFKVNMSKAYSWGDAQYSSYHQKPREESSVTYA